MWKTYSVKVATGHDVEEQTGALEEMTGETTSRLLLRSLEARPARLSGLLRLTFVEQ